MGSQDTAKGRPIQAPWPEAVHTEVTAGPSRMISDPILYLCVAYSAGVCPDPTCEGRSDTYLPLLESEAQCLPKTHTMETYSNMGGGIRCSMILPHGDARPTMPRCSGMIK